MLTFWAKVELGNLYVRVYETVSFTFMVKVGFHVRTEVSQAEDEWLDVFERNCDALATAMLVAEAFCPTQAMKQELWSKYVHYPEHLKRLANQKILEGG